jgi:hypothetical protein
MGCLLKIENQRKKKQLAQYAKMRHAKGAYLACLRLRLRHCAAKAARPLSPERLGAVPAAEDQKFNACPCSSTRNFSGASPAACSAWN